MDAANALSIRARSIEASRRVNAAPVLKTARRRYGPLLVHNGARRYEKAFLEPRPPQATIIAPANPGESNAKICDRTRNPQCRKIDARGIARHLANIVRCVVEAGSANQLGPQLRHWRQDLLHLHRAERGDGS